MALGPFKQKGCPLISLTSNSTKILLTSPQREGAGPTWAEDWTGKTRVWGWGKVGPVVQLPSGVRMIN